MSTSLTTAPTINGDIYADPAAFEHAQRVAKVFQACELVPATLRKNLPDVVVAFGIARAMNEQPLTVMQNIYFVSGKAGWSASYMVARANRAGVFDGPIRWRSEGAGENLSVTAFADLRGVKGDARVEATVSMAMAKAEGWTKNDKYRSMPEHMLRWRSATMLIRLYCPEVMFGLPVAEEIEPEASAPRVVSFSTGPFIDAEVSAPAAPQPGAASIDDLETEIANVLADARTAGDRELIAVSYAGTIAEQPPEAQDRLRALFAATAA